ncbi:hypothetical protein DAEQUDRAFT_766652 [Daedalea quercina L-15889]|uniref:Histone-lysine N-methyltransferase, H3 lysine-36 specific n=1 Tax=Daedalea quercina L-15889 TaxID=1314783 RepID=A0A165PDP0_9APHY|nr:hypothetical protein DAEQUDRAFT_766652 [Daedalea quercina L-15889]
MDHADGATPGVKLEEDSLVKTDIDDLYDFDMDGASTSQSPSSELKQETASLKLEDDRPSTTPPVSSRGKPRSEPQLIGHLPSAEEEALRNFVQLESNHYQYGTLGRSREALESMTCECQYEHGVDDPDDACGSDCINRLTQVECLPDDCRCRSYCQNQRFQRREYAPIEIVQTEMKGFGLRAAEDLPKDAFIYEYLGDVVSQPTFLKRMRQYAEEGIRHFYFMMLQKDEFIDATKRGGIGRFANHSCNPNCYVAKWTVDQHVRMGIFANRNIKKNEELTFNYNVDRYGHDAQPCYCGEPNCVGFIGGKTQTDIAAMDDLYLDGMSLGISEEVAVLGLKGSKKRKSKKLDEDFIPTLKPLIEKDIPKVIQALRQTQSRKVLIKLLTRIKMTEDQPALRQLMRLRGFSVMTNILEDYSSDPEVLVLTIECMMTWPLIQRNKVEDSKVNVPVQVCAQSENTALAELAQKLLAQWDTLEYAYRIPKRLKGEGDEDDMLASSSTPFSRPLDPRPQKRARPDSFFVYEHEATKDDFKLRVPAPLPPPKDPVKEPEAPKPTPEPNQYLLAQQRERDVAAIIAKASAAAEAALAAAVAAPSADADKEKEEEERRRREAKEARRKKRKQLSQAEKEASKEKRLLKLIGAVVVKCMSKHRDQFDHDHFKKHAKEVRPAPFCVFLRVLTLLVSRSAFPCHTQLTHIIAEKEKKSSSYREGRLDALSDEKVVKIKKFAKEYIAKILRKMEKKRRESGGGPSSASTLQGTSASPSVMSPSLEGEGADADTEASLAATVADVMDLDGPDDGDDDMDMDDAEQTPEQASPLPESETPTSDSVGTPSSSTATAVSDPRLRHRKEECGWDPNSEKIAGRVRPVVVSAVSVS